jgi:hypothetical protein
MDASLAQAKGFENPLKMVVKDNGEGRISQGDKRLPGDQEFLVTCSRLRLREINDGFRSVWLTWGFGAVRSGKQKGEKEKQR